MLFTTWSKCSNWCATFPGPLCRSLGSYLHRMTGDLRHASMGRSQGELICERPWEDTVLDISRKMECVRSLDRARHNSYGAR